MTRGEQGAVRNAMNDLSAKFWEFKTTKGNFINTIVQPIQLWSLVVPKEHMPTLQNTINTNPLERYHPPRDALYVAGLRKMLRAKKCPPLEENGKKRIIRSEGVEFLPIGIKEDKTIHSELKCEGL